jgi:hypothetical protein
MALTSEVFHQVHMPGAEPMDCAVTQANFRLAGEGNDILTARPGVPVAEAARLSLPKDNAFGRLKLSQVRVGFQV